MGKGQLCLLFLVLFMILISLALTLVAIVTDYWYTVDVDETKVTNVTVVNSFTYSFGMWRKCYDVVPDDVPVDRRVNKCAYTYQDLIPARDPTSAADKRYLHLERSWVGCLIASAAVQIFAILTLICGLWPADCNPFKRAKLYLVASILCLLAGMCGIASGICFIALRDMDANSREIYPSHTSTKYNYSFMLAWIGNGFCILEGFVFLCLLKMDYNDINESGKYNTFM
ncbi:hypothetical protein FSP39_006662 [Pinctada imbricata]|uniref:Uncharacterized protein n=1 Tax=Pinctada imbricata TaxID=66713 RepID=A0AA88XQE0_PINIB|nr:hypothetical protein FSP39_006662 [Pinctada imbricata]